MTLSGDFINAETGEIFENSRIQSIDEYERIKEHYRKLKEYEERSWEIHANYKQYGEFVWLLYNINEALNWGISPSSLTRIIYLSTFMDYQNRLMVKRGLSMMHKQDMQNMLILSNDTFLNFYNDIVNNGILIDKGKYYTLDMNKFARGKQSYENVAHMRLYIDGVRRLYTKARVSEHKKLSYLYQAIPYVNVQYNMLCFNPNEETLESVEPMTLKEFCAIIGYSVDNHRHLKSEMKKIMLDNEYAFSFVENNDGVFCYINPKVFYAGNKWDKVEILGEFRNKKKSHTKGNNTK